MTEKQLSLGRVALAGLVIYGAVVGTTAPQRDPRHAATELVDHFVDRFSGTVLVSLRGVVVFERSVGFADPGRRVEHQADTPLRAGRLAELLPPVVALRLVEEQLISLDEPVGRWLPEWRGPPGAIRIRQLMEHTSGLRRPLGDVEFDRSLDVRRSTEQLLEIVYRIGMAQPPGSYFDTLADNWVLVRILELASGQSWPDLAESRVFGPAGLEQTRIETAADLPDGARPVRRLDPREIHYSNLTGAADVVTTPKEVASLARALFQGTLLSESGRELLLDVRTDIAEGVGGGFGLRHARLWDHEYWAAGWQAPTGLAGWSGLVTWFPRQDLMVVILSNDELAPLKAMEYGLAATWLGEPYTLPGGPRPLVSYQTAPLECYIGQYESMRGQRLLVEKRAEQLYVSTSTAAGQALVPAGGQHRFVSTQSGLAVAFEFGANGYPVNLTRVQDGVTVVLGRRTRLPDTGDRLAPAYCPRRPLFDVWTTDATLLGSVTLP